MQQFATQLAAEIGHPVQVNAYVTPPRGRGFAAHYDVHDVFVLQVSGTKQWTIHEPVVTDPLDNDPWEKHKTVVASRAAEPPLIDTVLVAGDALYLPRGTIHAAEAQGDTSIHLTVGVHPLTRYRHAQQILNAASDNPTLRASLPMGIDLTDPAVLAPHIAATAQAMIASLETASVAEQANAVGEHLQRQMRPAALGPLAQLDLVETLTIETPVRLRGGERPLLSATSLRAVGRSVPLSVARE